ncbi:MAG: hypothetical protein MUF01_07640 [Bryobacterales bacterium]|jgi:hypothetical protein|nr:hypothetical protein [Bryobacterales bacterium]
MTTVQIIMADSRYASELGRLLLRDGQHRVLHLDALDEAESGVVVMDSHHFQDLSLPPCHPDQVVLVADHQEALLTKAWEAGLRSVVYADEPIQTTLLAVIAAELRLLKSVGLPWAPPAPA